MPTISRNLYPWGRRAGLVAGIALVLALTAGSAMAVRCPMPDLEQYRSLVRPVPADQMVPTHRGDMLTPPADPGVGDSWLWYTWLLAGYPQPELKMCTVRGEGEHCYVVVEDSQWNTRVNQADVDAIIEAWDNSSPGQWPTQGIHELMTYNFGPIPDALDNDPKVYILYYDFDISADGFFWYFDEYPDGSQPFASNECEVLYMNCSDNDPGGEYLISVQSHELTHMIHWLADDNETTWLQEALSELAMWIFGHPDPVVAFPSNPDNNLTTWQTGFADYVKVYLWSLYFYEHFGGQPTIRTLIAQPSNSIPSVQQTLTLMGYTTTVEELIADWTTANFLDDPNLEGGRFNYAGENLPTFASITKSTYPVPPTNASVNHYAADYVKFINGQSQRLNFDGGDTSTWTARVVRYLAGAPISWEDIALNATDAGYLDLPGFGSDYDQVVLVITNHSASGLLSYQYSTEGVPVGVEDPLSSSAFNLMAGANPVHGPAVLHLTLDQAGLLRTSIYDARGGLVRTLANGELPAGTHSLEWDGRNDRGDPVSAGVYFATARAADGRSAQQRIVVVR